jgi:hypothetical protein
MFIYKHYNATDFFYVTTSYTEFVILTPPRLDKMDLSLRIGSFNIGLKHALRKTLIDMY